MHRIAQRPYRVELARCWYCPQPATVTCTEKITSPWITFPGQLARYALIQDVDLNWYMVSKVEEVHQSTPGGPWLNDTVVAVTIVKRAGQQVLRLMRPLLPVLELRSEPCARVSCEAHARDLGDGEHWKCLQHWYDDAPRPPGELELARQWEGLLETTVQIRRKEDHK